MFLVKEKHETDPPWKDSLV